MTIIILPGEHHLIAAEMIIPEIEGYLGKGWNQPMRNNISIEIKDTSNDGVMDTENIYALPSKYDLIHAYMNQAAMNHLAEYSRSTPTAVYPGKMWKGNWNNAWYLRWFDEAPGHPNKCRVCSVPILLTDLLDLLNPDVKNQPMSF